MYIVLAFAALLGAVSAYAEPHVDQVLTKIPLAFERNEGQLNPKVQFQVRGQGYGVYLTGDEAVMRFTTPASSVVRMKFLGRNKNLRAEGMEALSGTTNYLLGRDSHKTNIHSYKKVRYSEVYDGIDVEYHGNGRVLEYDFIVKPGFDPSKIRIGFSGVRGMSVDSSGDLVLATPANPLTQKKPHAYQDIDGQRRIVDAAYTIDGGHIRFAIGEYDKTHPLVIDPELIYSTFFGGTGAEVAYGIAADPTGAIYVVGSTASTDFPTKSPAQADNKGGSSDIFVFKLNPAADQIVYSTYIGGAVTDEGHAIAVDAGGNAYITGYTQSNEFPIVNGFQKTRAGAQEVYVLKLNSAGTGIAYSTFLGGSADERGTGIALDAAGNIYVTGVTASTNFPTTAGAFQRNYIGGFADGFVTKISAAGSLVYSTFVGGIGNDNPLGIAVDGLGAAYVTGWTTSVNFPTVNAAQTKFGGLDQPVGTDDVFVLKLNAAGSALDYSTYIGGTGSDEGTRIAVDAFGSAYVTGYTSSLNFPLVKPYQSNLSNLTGFDAFVSKVAPDGKSFVFSTYFGGFQNESGTGIAVDATGAVYISGYTTSFDLPTANQIQGFIGGDRDAFLAKFDPVGNVLVFSTFLGGTGTESATGLTIDANSNVYVLGTTNSTDFNVLNAVQPAIAGEQDIFISKLNVVDIVSSSQFEIAPQGASSIITKGTRTDAVFGYAVAQPVTSDTQLTGLAIIDRKQNGATVSQVGVPAPPQTQIGRLFVDVTGTGRSVVSIANPSDQDATVDFFYTDQTGATNQYATVTVTAHQHFSRFVTDDPLLIFAPGTLNFNASIPIIASAFFTDTNEASELLLDNTPIVDPVAYPQRVGSKPITLPELAEGGGWKSDIVLVNPGEDRLNGEIRFFTQGNAAEPGVPLEIGIGDGTTTASVVEYDIPPRTAQKISTAGNATTSEMPFALTRGTSVITPGSGPFQVTGFASADATDPSVRLNGLEMIEFRQLGVTQSQAGIVAPALRQTGRFFAEVTDAARTFFAIANPNTEDVSVDVVFTDDAGTSGDPITVTVPANGQYSAFIADTPFSIPVNSTRTVNFSASLPVFVTPLRFFTNERADTVLSTIPIVDLTPAAQPVTIPHFADGIGWKTRVILVNNSDDELRGEVRFISPGSAAAPPQPVLVGTDGGDQSVFEYHIQPRSFFQVQTNGAHADSIATGSVQIVPFSGFNAPGAYDVISQFLTDDAASAAAGEPRGNTIFENPVVGQLPAASYRFYSEASSDFAGGKPKSTHTAVAIANPSSSAATVQLELTSFDDRRIGISSPLTIPANGQFSGFLFQVPGFESVSAPFQGVLRLTVLSGSGVTASAFRVMRNERLDLLMTTTGPLNENAGMPGRLIFPYLTDSTGYTSRFILINPSGAQQTSGVVHFLAPDATPLQLDILRLGWVQVVPFGGYNTPHAYIQLNERLSGVLTFMTTVEGELPAPSFRMYAESIGDFDSGIAGSTRSGVALANPSETPATVVLEMRSLTGTILGRSAPFNVPAKGQLALYLNQVPGLETLAAPFEGVLRVVATSPQGVTAATFRATYNERGNTIFTTTGPLIENAGSAGQLVFPHIAEGGGYTTQFIVISGASGQSDTGTLRFFNQEGNPLNLTLAPR